MAGGVSWYYTQDALLPCHNCTVQFQHPCLHVTSHCELCKVSLEHRRPKKVDLRHQTTFHLLKRSVVWGQDYRATLKAVWPPLRESMPVSY